MTQSDWRDFPALQQPNYPDQEQLQAAVARLRALPPLVTSWEIEALKAQLAEAASGQRLLLQGGDCAESFDECSSDSIAGKLKVLLQMSLVMVHGTRRPVVRVGRFAGQYAKPGPKTPKPKTASNCPATAVTMSMARPSRRKTALPIHGVWSRDTNEPRSR